MDEAHAGQRLLELGPQLVDVDVAGTVAAPQRAAPGEPVELVARNDATRVARERDEEVELPHRQRQGPAVGEHQPLAGADLEVPDPDKLAVTRVHCGRKLGGDRRSIRYPGVNSR